MRWGVPISLLMHALILGWGLIALKSTRDFKKAEVPTIALDIVTSDELAQMRKGDEKSKDKEAQAAKDAQGKAEKEPPKVKTAVAPPPPPPPAEPPKPPEPVKEEPKPDPIPDPIQKKIEQAAKQPEPPPKPPEPEKASEPPKPPEPKPEADDALAAMKDNQPKPPPLPPPKPPEPPKAAEKPPAPKPPPPKPKPPPKVAEARPLTPAPPQQRPSTFDEQMRRAGVTGEDAPIDPLLNKDPRKQEAMRSAAVADPGAKAKTAVGAREGTGNRLSQNEQNALVGQLSRMIKACYRAQAGNAVDRNELTVTLRFDLGMDGMLRGEPVVVQAARFTLGTQWAVNALKGCQPYRLDPEKYQMWKEVELDFAP